MASVLWKFSSFRTFKWEILSKFSTFTVRKFSNLPENSFLSTHKRYYTNWDSDENEANETINRNLWRNAIPKYAQIVICGASSVGNAIAYNLLKKGWTDVVVMEKGRIGETLSSIGNNIISTFNSSNDGIITQYNIDLFEELKTGGYDIGWKQWGAIDIARTKDRMIYFQRLADEAKIYGLEFEIIGPEDIKKICPLVNTEDLEGGLWKETDSVADPTKLCLAIAELARKEGAQYFEECQVLRILTENSRVTGVQTNFGITECEYLVVCAGMNTRELGQKCIPPFRVPIHFTDLPFIVTQPVHGIIPSLPIIRDYDGKFFCHKYDQGILIGGYFNEMKSRFHKNSENKTLELADIMPLYNEAKQRLPILSQVDIDQMVKVSYSFTPDGQWIAGKTPEQVPSKSTDDEYNGLNPLNMTPPKCKFRTDWLKQKDKADCFQALFDHGGTAKHRQKFTCAYGPRQLYLTLVGPGDNFLDPLKIDEIPSNTDNMTGEGSATSFVLTGAQYFEECQVLRILTENSRVTGVQTNFGITECEYLVVCAGMNTRELGQKCIPPFRVPIHFTDLPFIVTQPVHGIIPSLPIIRDYDGKFFCHKYDQGILIGGYFNEMKSRFHKNSENKTLELADIMPLYNEAKQRLPILSQVDIDQMVKVSYSFTPDGQWIAGKTPEIDNLFVTGGSNGNSLQAVGGLGRALANWISNMEPDSFMLPFDICRFIDVHNNYKFLQERVAEVVELGYTIPHPLPKEFNTARTLRCSPLYTIQDDAGAVFGERMGFERALYFDKTKSREERLCPPPTSFGKPPWFDIVRDEYIACRERVGLIDMSSFTKSFIMSAGTEVVNFLQLLCSNDVDIPVGCIVPTGMQNEKGGYENDCLLVRRANNCYFMISPTSQQTRLSEWMEKNLPTDGSISFNDVTSMYTVLNVVGPKSKELMTELTKTNMSIPSFTCKEMNVGYASEVMVMGFNNTGEPGYSLYVPSEYALHVYDRLATVGRDFGIKDVGYYTLRFLRIEKFIPFWGEELDSNTTPLEVGRSFKVKMQKNYFLGKVALQHQIDKGLFRRLVHFQLENHNPDMDLWPWGREPIFRNGKYVGTTTSSGYGFTLNRVVCLGFVDNFNRMSHKYEVVTNDYITKDAKFEVSVAGKRYVAKPSLHPPKIPIVTMSGTTRYTPRAVNGI
ncbi:pyruvate dehydrogenase phosphatase regulatory subunit, mitochondrial-like [Centruroides sculpturatus]|uniref:pyruvate dehydrogenase phosphatase regulatory subunit, mitochondrial-like n=1 Tax=Centruroides sculpturatus TaxID=218467 RepID=UPI000C6D50E1|nr:pyruvate dehydrogenase phosphatase regulatory subunit, mitochondrial-like [Centruroides sculpturatus]